MKSQICIDTLIRKNLNWILALSLGYVLGFTQGAFALKNDYEKTVKFLQSLGYRGEVCTKVPKR